jgi:hypothetical protein
MVTKSTFENNKIHINNYTNKDCKFFLKPFGGTSWDMARCPSHWVMSSHIDISYNVRG